MVTGASSGEFTLWNGLTFNFETILQVCDSQVEEKCAVWAFILCSGFFLFVVFYFALGLKVHFFAKNIMFSKFKVCDPLNFLNATYVVIRKA